MALKQISITLPDELYEQIKELAAIEHISISAWVRRAVQDYVESFGYEISTCWCLKPRPCTRHDQLKMFVEELNG